MISYHPTNHLQYSPLLTTGWIPCLCLNDRETVYGPYNMVDAGLFCSTHISLDFNQNMGPISSRLFDRLIGH